VEEFLTGIEASMLCFVDHHSIVPMASAQDYKRIFDGDQGPNTGGMGTYSPSLIFNEALEERIRKEILNPTLAGFHADGLDFQGVLFIGLMISEEGPKVIEFNNRFGDPETQSILPRMENDLLEVLLAVCENRLSEITLKWSPNSAVCVVLAAPGYPGNYEKGLPISGLDQFAGAQQDEGNNRDTSAAPAPDVVVFHAGTAFSTTPGSDVIVTSGGRVLGVTAMGDTHEYARNKAYENLKKIHFKGMQYRKDIGLINLK
jgi:phosphoribosylamine--glycine ligase